VKPTPEELEDAKFHSLDIEVYKDHRRQGTEHGTAMILAILTQVLHL